MQWNLDFMAKSDEGKAYLDVAKRVDEAIQVRQGHQQGCSVYMWFICNCTQKIKAVLSHVLSSVLQYWQERMTQCHACGIVSMLKAISLFPCSMRTRGSCRGSTLLEYSANRLRSAVSLPEH